WSPLAVVAANQTTFNHTNLNANTSYFYRLRSTNASGDSDNSTVTGALTLSPPPPAAPSDLTAVAIASNRIDLAWADNSTDETGFVVESGPSGDGPWTKL